jgi:hypothetical protein
MSTDNTWSGTFADLDAQFVAAIVFDNMVSHLLTKQIDCSDRDKDTIQSDQDQ